MTTTAIEWTDHTVQPGIFGCSIKSEACRFCYAAVMARRQEFMAAARGDVSPYAGTTQVVNGVVQFNGVVRTDAARIGPAFAALPKRAAAGHAFVTSMADVFHEKVPDDYIAEVFGELAVIHAESTLDPSTRRAPYRIRNAARAAHAYQVLTKRIERARNLLGSAAFVAAVASAACRRAYNRYPASQLYDEIATHRHGQLWPLPNVWIGATIEDEKTAPTRSRALAATPAVVRFASCEPLLGDIAEILAPQLGATIGWVIVGCESRGGRPGRPTDLEWVRRLRDASARAGAAFFLKQLAIDGAVVGLPALDGATHAAFPVVT